METLSPELAKTVLPNAPHVFLLPTVLPASPPNTYRMEPVSMNAYWLMRWPITPMTRQDHVSSPHDALTACLVWTQQRNAQSTVISNNTRTRLCVDAKAAHNTVLPAATWPTAAVALLKQSLQAKTTSATHTATPLISTTWKINAHNDAQTVLISTTLPSTVRLVMKSVWPVLEMLSIALHATSHLNFRANVSPPVLLITTLKMESVRLVHLKSKAVLPPCPLMSNKPLKTSSLFSSSSSTRKSRSMVTPKTLLKSGSPWNPEEEDSHKPDLFSKAKPTSSMMAWNSKLKSCPTEPWNSN